MSVTRSRPRLRAPRRPRLSAARFLAAPAVAAVVLAGVWVAGGQLTESFTGSVVLTTAWFALAGAAVLALGVRHRSVLWPVLSGYGVTALAVGAYLGWSMLDERVVDERVVVGVAPAERQADAGDRRPAAGERRPAAMNVLQATGSFRSGEHETVGRAALVRLPDGRRVVTLTGFRTSPGPDLRVRLVPGATEDGGADGARDLGALKGNRGDQQYSVPRGFDVRRGSVVIWCRAFSATFGSAVLRAV